MSSISANRAESTTESTPGWNKCGPYWETFEDFRYEIEEVIHAEDRHVIVAVRDCGRLSGSDAEVWTRFFNVFTFRNAKVVRSSAHLGRNRALEAAGLSE